MLCNLFWKCYWRTLFGVTHYVPDAIKRFSGIMDISLQLHNKNIQINSYIPLLFILHFHYSAIYLVWLSTWLQPISPSNLGVNFTIKRQWNSFNERCYTLIVFRCLRCDGKATQFNNSLIYDFYSIVRCSF